MGWDEEFRRIEKETDNFFWGAILVMLSDCLKCVAVCGILLFLVWFFWGLPPIDPG